MLKVNGPLVYPEGSDSLDAIQLQLEIKFPIYKYERGDDVIKRELLNHKVFKKILLIPDDKFEKIIPVQDIIAFNLDAIGNFIGYILKNLNRLNEDTPIQDSFEFDFILKDKSGKHLSTQNHKALFGFDVIPNVVVSDNTNDSVLEKSYQSLGKLFLINNEVYELLVTQIRIRFPALAQYNMKKYIFLYICQLADNSSGILTMADLSETQRQKFIEDLNNISEVTEGKQILDIIESYFNSLGEFPLQLPVLKSIEINGTLEIIPDSEREIEKRAFGFFDILTTIDRDNGASLKLKYDWNSNYEDVSDNTLPIVLAEPKSLILDENINSITVKVKAFDGATLWKKEFHPEDKELQNLNIVIEEYSPNVINPSNENVKDAGKKLRGKVIQYGDRYDLNELTIVVQTKKDSEEIWKIASAGKTDKSGNFSLDYPYGTYTEAQALVSLMPNSPVTLATESNTDKVNETIADDFIYLLIADEDVAEDNTEDTLPDTDEHCDCDALIKAKRLPDQADLIESSEYTQDIGGTCLNLSTPNRTLSEYNYNAIVRITDPDVAKYTLHKGLIGNKTTFTLDGGPVEREEVDFENPIRWQDAPGAESDLSIYQAVTVAKGHILHYKSIFKADGYSLGDLVYSLPLGPGQKKQIVVFESSHSLTGAESQTLTQSEGISADLISERSITDQLSGGLNEDLSGKSSAKTKGISAGLGASASYGGVGGSLGVAGGVSKSNSSASQNSSRNVSQFFGEKLRQSVMQNAESYRQLNASVVTTVTEGQVYGVTSEVVSNHNHCHSLTMMYFEVLRHYAIFQELSHVEECVFVPLLMTNFSTENIHKWKDILAQNLRPLHSNTYLQPFSQLLRGRGHPLLKAFDANERVKTDWTRVDFPQETYADDNITDIKGEFTMRVNLKRPRTRYDRIFSFPVISTIIEHRELDKAATAKAMFNPFDWKKRKYRTTVEEVFEKAQIFDKFMSLDQDFQNKKPADCIRVINFDAVDTETINEDGDAIPIRVSGEDFFGGDRVDRELWETYAEILEHSDVFEMLNNYFRNSLISEWDYIFNNQLLPEIFKVILETIKIDHLDWDINNTKDYTGGEQKIKIRITNGTYSQPRKDLPEYLNIFCNSEVVKRLESGFVRLDIENVQIDYVTDYFQGTLFNGYKGDDLLDEGCQLKIPLTSRDRKNPRDEDKFIVNELIEHLNSNLEFYNKVLWQNLDPDRRYLLLDGFNIEIFNSFGISVGYRSLASVVKNELITITGNSLVLPVADGYKVSQSFILEDSGEDVQQEISLFDHYKPLTPIPPYRISVPTRGVFMEAIQGTCDACEMVKENSSQDWDKFRTDEPTSISPIVTPTPIITAYKPEYKDFAPPLINIQNAPDAPAPAAGLSQLSELLGKAAAFNDITGLAGNQKNALETYLSNQANAKAFAEMSKSLATQQHNTQNSDDFMTRARQARESGAIDEEQYKNLINRHLEQQIDGEAGSREAAEHERNSSNPSLSQAAIDAARQGQSVHAERTDPDGIHESIEVEGSEPPGGGTMERMYDVPLIPQPTVNSCWAASMAMLISFRNQASVTPEDIVQESHGLSMTLDDAYDWESLKTVRDYYGFQIIVVPSNASLYFAPEQWFEWLNDYGPLWITTTGTPSHAIVIRGISGNLSEENTSISINNPLPVDSGNQTTIPFVDLAAIFGRLDLNNYGNWRILYLPNHSDVDIEASEVTLTHPPSSTEILELRDSTRSRFNIPGMGVESGNANYDGWPEYGIYKQRAALTKNNQTISEAMYNLMQDEDKRSRLEETLILFDGPGRVNRDDIDIPLLLVIAAREGGPNIVFSNRNNRIISAGRDTHPNGVSGLDYLNNAKHLFPDSIRNQIRLVSTGLKEGRENRRPASLPEKYLLAGIAVWIEYMEDRVFYWFRQTFPDNVDSLIGELSSDAKRAWISLGFAGTGYARRAMVQLKELHINENTLLNRILTDSILREDFHIQGAIVTVARCWMLEQMMDRS